MRWTPDAQPTRNELASTYDVQLAERYLPALQEFWGPQKIGKALIGRPYAWGPLARKVIFPPEPEKEN